MTKKRYFHRCLRWMQILIMRLSCSCGLIRLFCTDLCTKVLKMARYIFSKSKSRRIAEKSCHIEFWDVSRMGAYTYYVTTGCPRVRSLHIQNQLKKYDPPPQPITLRRGWNKQISSTLSGHAFPFPLSYLFTFYFPVFSLVSFLMRISHYYVFPTPSYLRVLFSL